MYLSELFLEEVDRDYSADSIKNAVKICDDEVKVRSEELPIAELLDFWDVYKEFRGMLDQQEMESFEIIRMGAEQGGKS